MIYNCKIMFLWSNCMLKIRLIPHCDKIIWTPLLTSKEMNKDTALSHLLSNNYKPNLANKKTNNKNIWSLFFSLRKSVRVTGSERNLNILCAPFLRDIRGKMYILPRTIYYTYNKFHFPETFLFRITPAN